MNVCQELVENILGTCFAVLTSEDVARAKIRIIDLIGCLVAGSSIPPSPMIVNMVKGWGGREESTIFVHGGKAPAHNVGMVNSIMARLLDYEPVGPIVEGKQQLVHLSSTTVPGAFAISERCRATGKELITALIVADDLASRIIAASEYSFDSGWEANGTVPAFGACAIAGKLLGFDENTMLNAFGIVLNQLAGTNQNVWEGTHAFVLPQGLATRAGIFSAELAQQGFSGVKDALMGKYGYFNLYCSKYHTDILTDELGRKFYSEGMFKLYPTCGGNYTAIENALKIVHEHEFEVENIDEVILGVASNVRGTFLSQSLEIGDYPPATAKFNLIYNVASVLIRKSVSIEHFTDEYILDPRVIELARKVKISYIPDSETATTFLNVRMKDGSEFSARGSVSRPGPGRSLTETQILDKFRANAAFSKVISAKNSEEALKMLEHLEEVSDISRIISLLVD